MTVNNRQGSALVLVMLYAMILTILGTSLIGAAFNEFRMERAHRNTVKAYYLAEAGIEKAIFNITGLDTIDPAVLKDTQWEMEAMDRGLVEPGASGGFVVWVKEADLFDVIYIGEGEEKEEHKRIYDVILESLADYEGTTEKVEVGVFVENYRKTGMGNKVQVYHWRQIRRYWHED